ncbi:hypothetical protein PN36_29285 [Candidatus Thiomargarita nelsonii]|uniref:YgiT-type zinc finger domain-containing protein n=1 Tax=Candidatus Thiomargarita nelsonii TaxID=1003181 RepID=A0A4E0QXK3_9GAMM|nr:hypothetical protein PN36_29285 [Candidatus Thiomargarita nelsonii]
MKCDLCNEEWVYTHLITRSYGKGEKLLVIENVPVMTCQHCGESYLTAETLHEIERIKLHRQSFAITRPVAVAAFTIHAALLNRNIHSNAQQASV